MPNDLTQSDLDYYRSRMAAELALAAGAADAQVGRAHRELAAKYSRRLAPEGPNDDDFDDLLVPVAVASRPAVHAN